MTNQTSRSQSGFTLVELAVVMIIIGLLIGGVLKGQELINNAQVTSTVAQVKGIEAATSTFRDTYAALPGDIRNPGGRLPNCTAAPCNTDYGAGNTGNGTLNNNPSQTPVGAEGNSFFVHLNAADLMTGIVPGAAANIPGGNFPEAKLRGNVIQAASATTAAQLGGAVDITGASAGLYLSIVNAVGVPAVGTVGLRATEASRIDAKLDDGVPSTGSVRAIGAQGAANGQCATNGVNGVYTTAFSQASCGLHIRIQS